MPANNADSIHSLKFIRAAKAAKNNHQLIKALKLPDNGRTSKAVAARLKSFNMKSNAGYTLTEFFAVGVIIVWIAVAIGWVANIVQLIGMIHSAITLLIVLKIVGIFAFPFGAVMGWIGMF